MWSMPLLINTSTWKEMLANWKLICLVFWNYGVNDDDHVEAKRNHSNLLSRIQSITNDPNSKQAIQESKSFVIDTSDVFEFDDENELKMQCSMEISRAKAKQAGKTICQSGIDRVVNISHQIENPVDWDLI